MSQTRTVEGLTIKAASINRPSIIRVGFVIATLLLSSCGYVPTIAIEPSDGAGKPIDTRNVANAVPKVEPITRAGNKSPYEVFGKTYFVLPSNKDYSEVGIASWYGTKFHGRQTSNGEIYDMYAMTAAHKSLPIPSYVRVTNLENKRSIIVRVNDRGPFHGPRLIDLSYVGALKLGFADRGTAKVLIEAIDPSGSQERLPAIPVVKLPVMTEAETTILEAYIPVAETNAESAVIISRGPYLQVGAFDNAASAQILQKEVRGFTALPILVQQRDNLFKVWIGPIADQMELRLIKRTLKQAANISGFTVTP
ncbi:MAG: septal ring lytic transglycosylase RlpA family protein [Pseudomonadales bacterium]